MSTTADTLEIIYTYGVITAYAPDGAKWKVTLADGGERLFTPAQVKAFASGVTAVFRALNDGNVRIHRDGQFVPGQYGYGRTLSELRAAAETHPRCTTPDGRHLFSMGRCVAAGCDAVAPGLQAYRG